MDAVNFTLPREPWAGKWLLVFDTAADEPYAEAGAELGLGSVRDRPGLSLQVTRAG